MFISLDIEGYHGIDLFFKRAGYLRVFSVLVILSMVPPVFASSYDGTYNYAYNLNGPNGWEEHRVDNGFIIGGGVISSNPPALSGTIDSSGNVRFTGPSPYGSPSATFTGTIGADGNGKGSYVDTQGLRGNWAVSKVSGGGLDFIPMFYNFIYSFSFIGELLGLSGRMAAIIGTSVTIAAVIVVSTIVIASASTKTASRTQGAPASEIRVPPPPQHPPTGITSSPQGLPNRLFLNSEWSTQRVSLSWNEPQYDRDRYRLQGYEVTQLFFDGSSTSPNRRLVDKMGAESRNWTGGFQQTFRWNTGGDIQGYRVDAVFKDITSDPPRYLRIGETSHAPIS